MAEVSRLKMFKYIFPDSKGYRFYTTNSEEDGWHENAKLARGFAKVLSLLDMTWQKQVGRATKVEKKDYYVSKNTFSSKRRKIWSLLYLNNIVIDIDDHTGLLDEECLDEFIYNAERAIKEGLGKKGFMPTLITRSGRGLHLWFSINQVDANEDNLSLYSLAISGLVLYLQDILKKAPCYTLTVDGGTSDATAGVIRIPYSYNTKTGRLVTADFTPVRYELSELAEGFKEYVEIDSNNKEREALLEPYTQAIKKEKAPVIETKKTEEVEVKKDSQSFIDACMRDGKVIRELAFPDEEEFIPSNYRALYLKRIELCERLVEDRVARGWSATYTKSKCCELRHNTLMIYYNSLTWIMDTEEARKRTRRLNKKFRVEYPEGELRILFKTMDATGYKFSNRKVIRYLELSKEEQDAYDFHIAENKTAKRKLQKTKKEERNQRVLEYYRNGSTKKQIAELEQLDEKTVAKIVRDSGLSDLGNDTEVLKLYKQGYTKAEIVEKTGLSKPTVLKVIKDSGLSDSDNSIRVKQQKRKGKTQVETAKILGLSIATVKRYWSNDTI